MQTKGLTTHEAKALKKKFGPNTLSQDRRFKAVTLLAKELFSLMNVMLAIAGGIAIYISDMTDGVLILMIVVFNTAVSFWQEFKAESTLHQLKHLTPNNVRAMRDGREQLISAEDVVPGDLILLETGDLIPADGEVHESFNFEVNESTLTGEAIPVFKKPGEPEHDLVFGGTLVSTGRGSVVITATGKDSKFGKIAHTLTQLQETATPLQIQIRKLAYFIAVLALFLSAAIFFIGISLGYAKFEMFFTAVSTMVAMVPESLPSIILVTLAVGVKRMALKKAVVRKLLAIEGLGSVAVICTDKTGTLTRGEMRVSEIYFNGGIHSPQEFKHLNTRMAQRVLDVAVIANTAGLVYKFGNGGASVLGDTTEGALLLFAKDIGIDYETHRNRCQVLDEFSFDQKIKGMSVVCKLQGEVEALVKGSPEFIIRSSTRYLDEGKVKQLDQEGRDRLIGAFERLSQKGYRVLGIAYKDRLVNTKKYQREEVESDLICLGFIALSDPIRPEAKAALAAAKRAGIRTVMITGDNEFTAIAVAKELGLADDNSEVVQGSEIEKYTDEELAEVISKVAVFARTNPEDKLRIVSSFQHMGLNIAVTGDGVNDALALKQAEIGIAMGKKGTDVAKEAADMVITDDNYATIVSAVEEGRTIYDNVHKAIRYLLSTNIGEVLTILLALILGMPSPFLPVQILWINLVSDSLPALALALDPKDPKALLRKPRPKDEPLISVKNFSFMAAIGLVMALISLATYAYVRRTSGDLILARTWTFNVMIVMQLLIAFLIHGFHKTPNKKLFAAIITALVMQAILLSVPALQRVFSITSIF